jgi:hypothetical protein
VGKRIDSESIDPSIPEIEQRAESVVTIAAVAVGKRLLAGTAAIERSIVTIRTFRRTHQSRFQ